MYITGSFIKLIIIPLMGIHRVLLSRRVLYLGINYTIFVFTLRETLPVTLHAFIQKALSHKALTSRVP